MTIESFSGRAQLIEPILEPELPIVDAHHHLWFLTEPVLTRIEQMNSSFARATAPVLRRQARYLFEELTADLDSGHNIRATVFVEGHGMYRAEGPDAMKSVGEVEFANGVAAMSASGLFGPARVCAGIVGNVDLRLGDDTEKVLDAHLLAGGDRYRGIRCGGITAYDDDFSILGSGVPHMLLDERFRKGFRCLQKRRLSYDVFILEPQLPELIDLARAFPDTQIILDHVGGIVGIGRYRGKRAERFPVWRENMRTLATCTNVCVKLGGLGMMFSGFDSVTGRGTATSMQLAADWRPYIETCIETFGVDRCMFEGNFPMDGGAGAYPVVWNALKRLTAGASASEKTALFSGTATRVYRLGA